MLLKCQINTNTLKKGFLHFTKCLERVLKYSYLVSIILNYQFSKKMFADFLVFDFNSISSHFNSISSHFNSISSHFNSISSHFNSISSHFDSLSSHFNRNSTEKLHRLHKEIISRANRFNRTRYHTGDTYRYFILNIFEISFHSPSSNSTRAVLLIKINPIFYLSDDN